MTYDELLKKTAERKASARKQLDNAVKGELGFLAIEEIKRDPGMVAWLWLAKEFCETLADHVEEFIDQVGMDSYTAYEISDIYMAYEDSRSDLYDLLPDEARLFD